VTDSGVGIDDATKNRMFEPFFTTKGVGKGTGLGLSTVYGIVKQSGGDIAVTSEPGHGTMFRIYLPLVTDRVPSQSEEPMAAGELATGSETVLVVEDDPAVRLLARATLQRSGYQVLEASNPQEAAVIASEYTEPIDLLLTDVIMPESQGAPLVDRLRIARPGIRVLYMSGYADDTIVHHGVLDEGTPFLPKPFTPRALVQKVRSVLTQRAR
jgi:two-component system cell cycle sensor histidine kinase/response regulator CckA